MKTQKAKEKTRYSGLVCVHGLTHSITIQFILVKKILIHSIRNDVYSIDVKNSLHTNVHVYAGYIHCLDYTSFFFSRLLFQHQNDNNENENVLLF